VLPITIINTADVRYADKLKIDAISYRQARNIARIAVSPLLIAIIIIVRSIRGQRAGQLRRRLNSDSRWTTIDKRTKTRIPLDSSLPAVTS